MVALVIVIRSSSVCMSVLGEKTTETVPLLTMLSSGGEAGTFFPFCLYFSLYSKFSTMTIYYTYHQEKIKNITPKVI